MERQSVEQVIEELTLLNTREVARVLGVSVWTVRTLAHRGELRTVLVGGQYRWTRAEVERYIKSNLTEMRNGEA